MKLEVIDELVNPHIELCALYPWIIHYYLVNVLKYLNVIICLVITAINSLNYFGYVSLFLINRSKF